MKRGKMPRIASKNTGNPIARIRLEQRLSIYEMGALVGVSGARICQIENGEPVKIPPRVLDSLKGLGYDPATIQAEYTTWRAERQKAILAAIKKVASHQ